MPKSRKRRTKRPKPAPGSRSFSRDLSILFAADDAELRGDAEEVLRIMMEHPLGGKFWAPWRVRRLVQLDFWGPVLPGWATSRWILAQALQHLGAQGGAPSHRVHRALAVAIELRGGPQHLPGVDWNDARCRVTDHDWAATPMGGYRLVGHDAGTVTWQDLADDETVRTPNIGSAALVLPGECVIGRLVPIESGAMFECVPLVVPDALAREIALDPPSWVEALRSAPEEAVCTGGDVHGLLTDLPVEISTFAVWEAAGLTPPTVPTEAQQAAAVLSVARSLLDGTDPPQLDEEEAVDLWACLGAALLSPILLVTLADTGRPADWAVLDRLAGVLAEPAASACRVLAGVVDDAA